MFIAGDSPRSADRVEEAIWQTIEQIAANPSLGHSRGDVRGSNILFQIVDRYPVYTIAYRGGVDQVEILRVLHGSAGLSSTVLIEAVAR